MEMVPTPRQLLEQVADLRFDPVIDARLQELMERHNFGKLNETERKELAGYVALNEQMSIVRGQAMLVLGRKPV
jgi:hypothetical protein